MRFGETGERSWTDYWQSPYKVSERGGDREGGGYETWTNRVDQRFVLLPF